MSQVRDSSDTSTGQASTRETILSAAARCFGDKGYKACTVQGIAREAGFTPPTVYAHFGSKQKLFAALVGEVLEDLHRSLAREVPEGLLLGQRLELQVRELLELAERRREVFALLILRPYELPFLPEHEDEDEALERFWAELFSQYPDELGGQSAREASLVMEGVLYGFIKAWIRSGEATLVPQTRRIVALVLRGVTAP